MLSCGQVADRSVKRRQHCKKTKKIWPQRQNLMLASVGRKRANKDTEKMIFALVLLVDIRRKICSFKYYLVWRISIFDVRWFFTSARQPKIQLSSWYAKQQFLWWSAFLSLSSLPISTYFCLILRLKSPFVFYVYQGKKNPTTV